MLEESQLIHLAGPSRDAAASGRPMLVADIATDTRWDNDFRRETQLLNARAMYCQPVIVDDRAIGVITLYGTRPDSFAPDIEQLLHPFLTTVTSLLINRH